MTDVRRIVINEHSIPGTNVVQRSFLDSPNGGTHALMPWEEYERLRKERDTARNQFDFMRNEYERLRKVVDAMRPIITRWSTRGLGNPLPGEKPTDADLLNELEAALRELEDDDE